MQELDLGEVENAVLNQPILIRKLKEMGTYGQYYSVLFNGVC